MDEISSADSLHKSNTSEQSASASSGNVAALPAVVQQGPRTSDVTSGQIVAVQTDVNPKPTMSAISVALAPSNVNASGIRISGSPGVKYISMQNLMRLQVAASGAQTVTAPTVVSAAQLGQISQVRLTTAAGSQVTPLSLAKGNFIIGNRIVQCIVPNSSAVAQTNSPSSKNSVTVVQTNSDSNVQLKLVQSTQNSVVSSGQAVSSIGTISVAPSPRALAGSNVRMSAVLPSNLVRTILAANMSSNTSQQPRAVVTAVANPVQQQPKLAVQQPQHSGAVTVQIVRPSVSVQTGASMQAGTIQCLTTPQVAIAGSTVGTLRLPTSAVQLRTGTPQKKIVLVANQTGSSGGGNITYLTTSSGQSLNKVGQQLPITLLASPSSGTGNVRYIAIRGGVPVQMSSSSSTPNAVSVGTRVVAPAMNVTVVSQASSGNPVTTLEGGNVIQAVAQGSKINVQDYLKKVKEQQKKIAPLQDKTVLTLGQQSKGGIQVMSSKSLQVIQQQPSLTSVKSSTAGQVGPTIYIITNNNSTSSLTAVSGSSQQQLMQTKALSISSGLGTTAIRPKIVTVGPGTRTIQVVTRDDNSQASSTTVPVFVDGHTVKLTKAQQNQKKANRILAEAIAKAHAEGIELDTSDVEGKRKKKRKAETASEDEPLAPKKKREARPRGTRTPRRGGKKTEKSGSGDEGGDCLGNALDEFETGNESDKSKKKPNASGKPAKKKKRPLPTFLKNKKRKRAKDDSDASDVDLGTPATSILDGEDSLQMRRSARVVKRKKYVDDLDLNLSEDESNDAEKTSELAADDCDGLPSTFSQKELFEDIPAEEDAQIVEKILGMRIGKRKVPLQPSASNQKIEAADVDLEVDVECSDEKKDMDRRNSLSENVKDVEVEEFYVKYKNYSFLHCEWRTADELLVGDKRMLMKIKRFKLKRAHNPFFTDVDEEDLFNPDYVEVDRILDVAVTIDPVTSENVTHYLVTWRSLPYEDATWELEQDVDQTRINMFLKLREPPTDAECKYKPRPSPKEWKALSECLVYKNSNTLREYQLEGLNWLTFSYYNRQNCILADEMGLGKTIQSITFLHEVYEYGIRGPFLIIVPLSTVGNWQREFEAWTDINVIVYHGSMASRNMLRQYEMYYLDDKGNRRTDVYKFHALITTYEVIISDFEELSQIDWRVAVIDEAHRLKNRNCKLLQGLSCFELEHRVLLTGTPLQNNVDELFSLLSFLEPRQFSSSEAFMAEFGKLETEGQVDKLKALLKPMMLRRLKEDVEKSLAPKEETIVEVELTNIQKRYYRAILERNFSFLAKGGSTANIPNLMNTMMELRKCCNHPYLINGAEEQILEELMVTRSETEKLFQTMIQASGKLVLVDKLLPKLKADGHKVLVFSQMIRVLDIIEDYLLHKHYAYERIDGRIRGNLRQEAIDRFSKPESDRFVFLLCTRAGGLGINLTAADTVIIFDSDWNPQNDLQAQARCHRIGQMKAVKVYRLITRNTYEKEMFDRASLKLGLDKAVLQSMGNKEVNLQNQLSKKEIEDLLKKGAYGALMDDDNAGEEFCEEDIEHILQRRTQVIQIEAGVKGSTFAKASFNLSTNRSDIEIDDPNFWQKWAKKADLDLDEALNRNDLIMDLPRQRKVTARYGKQDNIVNMSELDTSNSESDDGENLSTGGAGGRRSGKRKKRGKSSRGFDDSVGKVKCYTRSDCFKVEKNLLVYGWGRWQDILLHGRFKHRLGVDDVITITRAMLVFSLQHYDGDDRIKKFIFDLISPSEDGLEKDYKNHTGLSAPVPRGRKGKKVKKDVVKKAQFDEDLTKLDIDVDSILIDEGYKKHLKRQSNKVLLRVRLLYYLKQEVIGRQAEKIFSGAPASEIDVPVLCADVDIPIYWWDSEADRCLLVGVFKHGYEKYNQMRQDQKLCFLSRCGPPDGKALLAEQNDDDDIKDEEEEEEPKPRRRGRKKKEKKAKKAPNFDDLDESGCIASKSRLSKDGGLAENGKLPFPSASDLNTRFRRIITSFQRSHKQGMLKLEQVAKKMHRREQMKEGALNLSEQYIAPTDLQSMHLEGVGGNPLLLAEQLNWTRREEADFYRVVSTFGVERDCATGQFIWDNFRNLGRLERKLDDTLTEYFKAFYHMCMKVCDRFRSEEEARPPNGLYVMPITAERANRCLARIDLLSKIREQILWHPRLDERLSLCQPSSYFPDWWICGLHDKDLLVGAAKHGVSRTDDYILKDPHLSFYKYAKMHADQIAKDEVIGNAVSESCPSSPRAFGNSDAAEGSQKIETGIKVDKQDIKEEEKPNEEFHEILVKSEKDDKPVPESKEAIDSAILNDTERGNTSVVEDVKEELDARGPDSGPTDSPKHPGMNDDEEGGFACVRRFNNQWPKDRIVFHRLENICYCVELGRWKVSQRHHANSQLQVMDSSCNTPNAGMSLPGTPVGGGHDYTIVPDEQVDSFKFKLQKRRRRRTKAEIEAGIGDDKQLEEDGDMKHDVISSAGYLKKKRGRKMQSLDLMYDGNDDPDAHVSVVNQLDGSRLSGDEAPTQRELSTWLDEHPDYVVEKQLLEKNLHLEAPIQRQNRRPRLDPSKLVLEDLTGDENVAVVNRNTGKRITGVKAPTLRHLGPWLVRNPGFDIDPKWAHIVRQMGSLPEELACRIAAHSGNSSQPKSVAMPANISNEELYKTLCMARLAAMADQQRVVSYSPMKGLAAVEQANRAIYAANMAGMGLLPSSSQHDDEDSSSESHDSSSPKPSTSAFLIPSSLHQEEEEEEGEVPFSFMCDPGIYGTPVVQGMRRPQVAHPRRQHQPMATFHLEQLQNNPANLVDTDSEPGNSLEMGEVSDDFRFDDGLPLGASAGSRMSENVRLRLASQGGIPSLSHYMQPGRTTLNQGPAWESTFGTRLKPSDIVKVDLPVASQETLDESSDSSDDEFVDD